MIVPHEAIKNVENYRLLHLFIMVFILQNCAIIGQIEHVFSFLHVNYPAPILMVSRLFKGGQQWQTEMEGIILPKNL